MDELDELIRTFRYDNAIPSPVARAAARERLVAHIAGGADTTPVDEGATTPSRARPPQPARRTEEPLGLTNRPVWSGGRPHKLFARLQSRSSGTLSARSVTRC